LEEITT